MTARARFTQSDVTRTVRAVAAAKVLAAIIISPDGTIRIEPFGSSPAPAPEPVAQLDPVVM
jgi:hypothetical protein